MLSEEGGGEAGAEGAPARDPRHVRAGEGPAGDETPAGSARYAFLASFVAVEACAFATCEAILRTLTPKALQASLSVRSKWNVCCRAAVRKGDRRLFQLNVRLSLPENRS